MTKDTSPSPAEQPVAAENLAAAIHRRFAPLGGVDDLTQHPPVPVGESPREVDRHMRRDEFRIGGTFWSAGWQWRCTDIGRCVITEIMLDHEDDPSWYNGPPYAVAETVFDEDDIEGCTLEPDPDDAVPPRPLQAPISSRIPPMRGTVPKAPRSGRRKPERCATRHAPKDCGLMRMG